MKRYNIYATPRTRVEEAEDGRWVSAEYALELKNEVKRLEERAVELGRENARLVDQLDELEHRLGRAYMG